MDLVSVILPTYNRAYCLQRAIDSVLNQTYQNIELIIVDDCSSDGTDSMVEQYQKEHKNIIYVRNEENRKVCYSRNRGMKLAHGAFIAFQDSDNCWMEDKLEKQLAAIEASNADYSYHRIHYVIKGKDVTIPALDGDMSGDIYKKLLHHNIVDAPSLIMKRECYADIGEFDSDYPALEDYDYALRLAKKYKAAFVNEVLMESGYSEDGISVNIINYITASCIFVGKHKKELLEAGLFDYKVTTICDDAREIGMLEAFLPFLEKMIS